MKLATGLGTKTKLGTKKRPALLRVTTWERATEVAALCSKHNWRYIVDVGDDKPEDVSDLGLLMESCLCPCGSGSEPKDCCGREESSEPS